MSSTGDKCHRDIVAIKDKHSKDFAKNNIKSPNVYMCCNGEETQLTKIQYEDLLNNLCQQASLATPSV